MTSKIETDQYSFDESPAITPDVIDKTIADVEKDYDVLNSSIEERYINNRIKNTMGVAIKKNNHVMDELSQPRRDIVDVIFLNADALDEKWEHQFAM